MSILEAFSASKVVIAFKDDLMASSPKQVTVVTICDVSLFHNCLLGYFASRTDEVFTVRTQVLLLPAHREIYTLKTLHQDALLLKLRVDKALSKAASIAFSISFRDFRNRVSDAENLFVELRFICHHCLRIFFVSDFIC